VGTVIGLNLRAGIFFHPVIVGEIMWLFHLAASIHFGLVRVVESNFPSSK
jgi:hypothetical protein